MVRRAVAAIGIIMCAELVVVDYYIFYHSKDAFEILSLQLLLRCVTMVQTADSFTKSVADESDLGIDY